MATATKSENKTLLLLRHLAAEKKATKKQLRKAMSSDSNLQKAIDELDRRHAQGNS